METYKIYVQVIINLNFIFQNISFDKKKKNRKHRNESNNQNILNNLKKGKQELESLKRQVIVDRMYSSNNTIHRLNSFNEANVKYSK